MGYIQGIAASRGIAMGKALCIVEPSLSFEKKKIDDPNEEISRLEEALLQSIQDLEMIKKHALEKLGKDKADIFEAHILVLQDPELIKSIHEKIRTDYMNAEAALKEVTEMFVALFEQMDNEYMRERAADIRDVSKRVLSHLLGVKLHNLSLISEEVIVVAHDLTPSDTAQLNRQFVKGFVTNIGGRTSHSAIMARTLEIPAVVGTKMATKEIVDGDFLIVDGIRGEVHIHPTDERLAQYKLEMESLHKESLEWEKLKNEKTYTIDNHYVELAANIGTPKDIEGVIHNGGEAIGLYRTEFLYMGRNELPTEDEQFEAYRMVLEGMNGKPVVVRTLDIGGDKELPYLKFPHEMNPFLGFRAIRLCLKEQEIFRTQLRALLRSSMFGNLRIMFPMIATLQEYKEARSIFEEERENLQKKGVPVADNIQVGIMVEIPSTAVCAEQFAKEVDFFSIGTNDLIQYTFAADRMNEQVSYLYQPYHPAILRLVKMVIDAAHKEGKWVGMCGEMAGDELAIPILIGLGLDEFSMSSTSILRSRSLIHRLKKTDMERIAERVLQLSTQDEVKELVEKTLHQK